MIHWREGRVISQRAEWPGVREVVVRLATPLPEASEPVEIRAIAFLDEIGRPEVDDRVLLNVSALARGLGTGGFALIVAIPDRLPADPPPSDGHLVKARYTPLQTMVLGVDDQESPHHETLRDVASLEGLPVIVADLHSAVPAIVAGIYAASPGARVAYVMTDGGALPARFSRSVAELTSAGRLLGTVSVGQSFGGDLEAVTVHTGLLAAKEVLKADIVIVAQGPGNLGTGTPWGFSGVAAGEALNAAGVLGGRPIASLRVSGADLRERHLGISHHSLTAYGKVALAPSEVVVPKFSGELADLGARVVEQALQLGVPRGRHSLVEVATDGLYQALQGSPARLSTMGRGLDEDPSSFLAAAAAGRYAALLLT
ncbi:DUF3866 family protein [Saxibacter everestensis]|uniref:DUF3866 family protein n=1 Tax=Saxibacter everestensis TaxID=2909229 RepID=A0ABY8QXU1_9MICO|nr:DUF3866 family protein [Brevibacteriaceae bacterium ZFBP1038]